MLDSNCSHDAVCNSLKQTVHTHRASVHQAEKLVAALLRVARVSAVLAESNGSLPPGLWLMSPAGWLPRTGISSQTLCSVIEYGLPLLFYCVNWCVLVVAHCKTSTLFSWLLYMLLHFLRLAFGWHRFETFLLAVCFILHAVCLVMHLSLCSCLAASSPLLHAGR